MESHPVFEQEVTENVLPEYRPCVGDNSCEIALERENRNAVSAGVFRDARMAKVTIGDGPKDYAIREGVARDIEGELVSLGLVGGGTNAPEASRGNAGQIVEGSTLGESYYIQ